MAKWYASLVVALFAAAGCQQTPVVESLPAPNYNGPTLSTPPVAPPAAIAKRPIAPGQPPLRSSGGPRDWIPIAQANAWRYIVIHHSATPTGGAAAFDKMHRAKGWDELGYHFVVGNGTDTTDGRVEVGPRWPKQKWGAHCKTPDNRYNDFGIGICLVGNFDASRPSAAQMQSVEKLVAFLMKTYHISPDRVVGHGDAKPTDCPGRYMNVATVRRGAAQILADAGESVGGTQTAAANPDLLVNAPVR